MNNKKTVKKFKSIVLLSENGQIILLVASNQGYFFLEKSLCLLYILYSTSI